MRIKSLRVKDFRNYDYLELEFDEETNIFYGDNAQGKTNILEAIYMAGTSKSHRGTKDKEVIQFDKDSAHIEACIEKNGIDYQIDMHLKKMGSKGIAINRIPIKKVSELFGIVHVVFFSPEDLNIIKNGPGERRRFIDFELSQLDKMYLSDLISYNKIINQRNHLLKEISFHSNSKLIDTLDIWDEQLILYGNKIIDRRKKFIGEINKKVSLIHKKLTGNKEELSIIYEPSNGNFSLEQMMKKNRERDLQYKNTSAGPHRDDISFKIGNVDIRKFGSQGQQRTTALSLKLSEIELVREKINDTPVLLLDDVLSELDKHRQNYLLESIHDIQTMITCTGVEDFVNDRFKVNKIFHVHNGQVEKEN